MPKQIVAEIALDPRVSGLAPEPPLRLTLAASSDDEERNFMRAVLRHYVWQFGPEAVIEAVQELAEVRR